MKYLIGIGIVCALLGFIGGWFATVTSFKIDYIWPDEGILCMSDITNNLWVYKWEVE